jgi:hypothetical protein
VAAAALLLCAGSTTAQTLSVTGLDGGARTLSAADLAALPRAEVPLAEQGKVRTYEGPRLDAVLRLAGLPLGARIHGDPLKAYLVVTGADGFAAVYSLAEVDPDFHAAKVVLADKADGAPLPAKHAPWRLVSSNDRKPWRAVYAVKSIEARSIGGAKAATPAPHAH